MKCPASEVYQVVCEQTPATASVVRSLIERVSKVGVLLDRNPPAHKPIGMIVTIVDRASGDELFCHVEDIGDGHSHLSDGLQRDLESMTAAEFKARWVD